MKEEAKILDGKKLALNIRSQLKQNLSQYLENNPKEKAPTLATILVGKDPASATYVNMKIRACAEVGLSSRKIELSEKSTTKDLLHCIDELNQDPSVSGILLQHPVPKQIDERSAFDKILAKKDVDGVGTLAFGKVSLSLAGFAPCTPAGILRLLDHYSISLTGKHAVVVGRSPILGRPIAMMLLKRNATVSICHSHTKNLKELLSQADLVVGACAKKEFIQGSWLKEGVILIDAGYHPENLGDVHYPSCFEKASYITPVPGGVGPMTIAMLLEQSLSTTLNL